MVKVDILDLNIRKGPGTDHARTGKFTGVGGDRCGRGAGSRGF